MSTNKLPKRRFFVRLDEIPEAFPYPMTLTDRFTVDHAIKVLRLKAGDNVLLLDENGSGAYKAEILENTDKKTLALTLIGAVKNNTDSLSPVILAAGLIKEQHWEWLLQKATELGVQQVIPIKSQFSDIVPRMLKMERWQGIIKAAVLQSEGTAVPEISELTDIQALAENLPENSLKILLSERAENIPNLMCHLNDVLSQHGQQNKLPPIVLAIGPEGGWHADELLKLQQVGFQSVSLGTRILRAETAAIVSLGITLQMLSAANSETS